MCVPIQKPLALHSPSTLEVNSRPPILVFVCRAVSYFRVFRPSATVSRIGLVESCTVVVIVVVMGPPPTPPWLTPPPKAEHDEVAQPYGVMSVSLLSWQTPPGWLTPSPAGYPSLPDDNMMDGWGRSAFTLTKRTCCCSALCRCAPLW